ncbi:hypothetical protein ANO11243_012070 [Dothideomycetidae sp. 11243]|nr:hypothetical protein ANO11243_012070 [fungal sp. No.11243]
MATLLPASRPGCATARFYQAFHAFSHLRHHAQRRRVHALLCDRRVGAGQPVQCDTQTWPCGRDLRTITIMSPKAKSRKWPQVTQINLEPEEFAKFQTQELEGRIPTLTHQPHDLVVEQKGEKAKIQIMGTKPFVQAAVRLVIAELGSPATFEYGTSPYAEDIRELEREGLKDAPAADGPAQADDHGYANNTLQSSNLSNKEVSGSGSALRSVGEKTLAKSQTMPGTILRDYEVLQISKLLRVPPEIASLFPQEAEFHYNIPGTSMKQTRVVALETKGPSEGRPFNRNRAGADAAGWTNVRITGPLANVDHVYDQLDHFVKHRCQAAPLTATPELVAPFKAIMRSVVSPVAIVTTRKALKTSLPHSQFAECIGATISSLSSVCVQPTPVVSFNLHEMSGTAASILQQGTLTVHILAADKHGEAIASAFANSTKAHSSDPFKAVAKLDNHDIQIDEAGHVVIYGPGVLAQAYCHLINSKTVSIGDHQVMFANVVRAEQPKTDALHDIGKAGLSFAQSTYLKSQPLDVAINFSDVAQSPTVMAGQSVDESTHVEYAEGEEDALSRNDPVEPSSAQRKPQDVAPFQHPKSRQKVGSSRTKKENDTLLDEIASFDEPGYPDDALSRISSAPSVPNGHRAYSTLVRRKPGSQSRLSSTSTAEIKEEKEDAAFLKQTVAEYFNLAAMPKHRWRNERTLAELHSYGPKRIALAISGGNPGAPRGPEPGGTTNRLDARIRSLIGRMHNANRVGHVTDEVMEELVLGPGVENDKDTLSDIEQTLEETQRRK